MLDPTQAGRLLRTNWTANDLARELYAIVVQTAAMPAAAESVVTGLPDPFASRRPEASGSTRPVRPPQPGRSRRVVLRSAVAADRRRHLPTAPLPTEPDRQGPKAEPTAPRRPRPAQAGPGHHPAPSQPSPSRSDSHAAPRSDHTRRPAPAPAPIEVSPVRSPAGPAPAAAPAPPSYPAPTYRPTVAEPRRTRSGGLTFSPRSNLDLGRSAPRDEAPPTRRAELEIDPKFTRIPREGLVDFWWGKVTAANGVGSNELQSYQVDLYADPSPGGQSESNVQVFMWVLDPADVLPNGSPLWPIFQSPFDGNFYCQPPLFY